MRRDPGYEAVSLYQKANKNGRQQQADVQNNGDVGRGRAGESGTVGLCGGRHTGISKIDSCHHCFLLS